jgi:hypothetical protein
MVAATNAVLMLKPGLGEGRDLHANSSSASVERPNWSGGGIGHHPRKKRMTEPINRPHVTIQAAFYKKPF